MLSGIMMSSKAAHHHTLFGTFRVFERDNRNPHIPIVQLQFVNHKCGAGV